MQNCIAFNRMALVSNTGQKMLHRNK